MRSQRSVRARIDPVIPVNDTVQPWHADGVIEANKWAADETRDHARELISDLFQKSAILYLP
jgi:hypothetical protein